MNSTPHPSTPTLRSRPRRPPPSAHPQRAPSPKPRAPARASVAPASSLWSDINTQWTAWQSLASTTLGAPASAANKPVARRPAPKSWLAELLTVPPPPPPAAKKRDSPPPPPPSAETLVYVHPVSAATTLEGVVIAFDTSAAAVRRTNGLWPGDPIQSRSELLIPVDECRIKGMPPPLATPPPPPPAGADYRVHSLTVLPGIGPTVVALMPPRRVGRRKERAAAADEPADPRLPDWMTPGVHTFHPEEENTLEWEDLVRGAEGVGGKVEGWIRQFGEGLRVGVPGVVEEVGELIEMVSGVGAGSIGGNGAIESAPGSASSGSVGRRRRKTTDVSGLNG